MYPFIHLVIEYVPKQLGFNSEQDTACALKELSLLGKASKKADKWGRECQVL